MRKILTRICAGLAACAFVFVPSALAFTSNPDSGAGDTEVTVGSEDSFFSGNKQNEPAVAIDSNPASGGLILVAGSNDNIDMERCNAGADNTCPFTDGVGVSGVYFSFNGGASWSQPTYPGFSARNCVGSAEPPAVADDCVPQTPTAGGLIGTLPRYFENGLVADGDPAVAFGPRRGANGLFSWANGSRLYYANLTSNFSTNRSETAFPGFEAIAVSRTDNVAAAAAGGASGAAAWMAPVIVSKQNAALFSDKEQIWADNAASSKFFGNVYICNTSFRSVGGAPEPILLARSTDGGDTWSTRQISPAANTNLGQGRQGCSVRTDSTGVVYVFWESASPKKSTPPFFTSAQLMARSFDGGATFERPRVVTEIVDCGQPDPATGRLSFDGVAGARTDSFPSVDIGNGAPTGAGARNLIVMTWCNGPTPTDTAGGANEQAVVQWSLDRGLTWHRSANPNAAAASDRPDFPAVAVSPDSSDVYVTYEAFHTPWQSTTANPRLQEGVVRHADFTGVTLGAFADLHRGASGDARGSSQNNLAAEFLGDYNYAAATNTYGTAVWNDVRQAADCPAIDAYRTAFIAFVTSSGAQPADEDLVEERQEEKDKPPAPPTPPTAPEPNNDCTQTPDLAFGNSDIWGGSFPDPTP